MRSKSRSSTTSPRPRSARTSTSPTRSVTSTGTRRPRTLVREGLALARRVGNRQREWTFLGQVYPHFALGAWDELESMVAEIPEEHWSEVRPSWPGILFGGTVNAFRGRPDDAETLIRPLCRNGVVGRPPGARRVPPGSSGLAPAWRETHSHALEAAELAFAERESMGITQEYSKQSFVTAVEAALALGDLDKAEELLAVVEAIPAGSSPQFLQAQSSRFRAQLAARQGDADEAERRFKRAAGLFRELALLFYLGSRSSSMASGSPSRAARPRQGRCLPKPVRSSSGWERSRGSSAWRLPVLHDQLRHGPNAAAAALPRPLLPQSFRYNL